MAFATTSQEYYENQEHWGENQFITLENVLDNILLTADDDSYFKHIKRFRARIIAKQGIKKLNVDIGTQNKAIAIDVPPSKIFPFPQFATDWYRVSALTSCGTLKELGVNNNPYISGYLQDHNAELLYDQDGDVLEDGGLSAEYGYCSFKIECEDDSSIKPCANSEFNDSWVKYNKKAGYFEFSEDLIDKTIVIEYMSAGLDGADDCDIKINHNLETTITYWTKWKLLESKRNVPMNEVIYLRNEYLKEKRRSKTLMGKKFTIGQLLDSVSLRYYN